MTLTVNGYETVSENGEKVYHLFRKREESQIWSKFKKDKCSNQIEGMKVMKMALF